MARAANKGTFKPGQVTNPRGRPKDFPWFKEECRKRTPEALAVLDGVMRGLVPFEIDGETKHLPAEPKDRLKAIDTLLGYGYGKPAQSVTGEGGEGPVLVERPDYTKLTDEELATLLALRRKLAAPAP